MESNLLYSISTDNFIQKHFTEISTIMFNHISGHRAQPSWYIKLGTMETMMFIFQFSLDIFISFLQISFSIFIDNFYSSLANIFVEKTLRVTHIQSYGIVLWGQTHRESISMRYVLVYCCPQNSGKRILSHQTSDGRRETSLSWCGTSPTWLADSMR